jgi:hypothetical protein
MSSRRLSRERERERDRCLGELAFILLSCRFFWKGERERERFDYYFLITFIYIKNKF